MVSTTMTFEVPGLEDVQKIAQLLAQALTKPLVVFLTGELGVGKTTLVQFLLRDLGYLKVVKSPTYTFVESYTVHDFMIHHFDLYRISSVEELEFIGFYDYVTSDAILLIEWPEQADGYLPASDLNINWQSNGDRRLHISAGSKAGEQIVEYLKTHS